MIAFQSQFQERGVQVDSYISTGKMIITTTREQMANMSSRESFDALVGQIVSSPYSSKVDRINIEDGIHGGFPGVRVTAFFKEKVK
jgi:uncharacterized protein (DUF433 family)